MLVFRHFGRTVSFRRTLDAFGIRTFTAMSLPKDIIDFLHGYPDQEDDSLLTTNVRFYRNELRCRPDNLLIDDLHTTYDW